MVDFTNPIKEKGVAASTTNTQTIKTKLDTTVNKIVIQPLTSCDCDRFKSCSANICPLDKDWHKRVHHSYDRVCFYLIEAQKINAEALFKHTGREYLYRAIQAVVKSIISSHSAIKFSLERAKESGSRMARKVGG